MFRKPLTVVLAVAFLTSCLGPIPKAHADVLDLPIPGTMVNLSPAYEPVMIKGLTVHKDNPFLFDFIVDVGQDKVSGEPLKEEGQKLIKYFLASLAIPEKDLWVNLSPYEKDKTIPAELSKTDMGRDLLAQDYILKQITASLIYPEKQLGKTFWDKIYTKAQQLYGTTEVPVNTFNKVWIMADKAEVFEHNQTAFVTDSHLKVMLEEDYLALSRHQDPSALRPRDDAHSMASDIVRQIILPELEKEVNTGKNFANLRQIFNSLILASWYKKNLKEALLNQVYSDHSKVKGLEWGHVPRPQAGYVSPQMSPEQIYNQYLQAYKKGVFNYIKEDIDASKGTTIPRKYFSGGVQIDHSMAATPTVTHDLSRLAALAFTALFVMTTACAPKSPVNLPPANVPVFQPTAGTVAVPAPAKSAMTTDEQKRAERLKAIDEVLARIDAGKKNSQGKEIDLGFYREPAPAIDLLLEAPTGLLKITQSTGSSLPDGYYFSVLPGETLDGLLSWLAGQKKEPSPDRAMVIAMPAAGDGPKIEHARKMLADLGYLQETIGIAGRYASGGDPLVLLDELMKRSTWDNRSSVQKFLDAVWLMVAHDLNEATFVQLLKDPTIFYKIGGDADSLKKRWQVLADLDNAKIQQAPQETVTRLQAEVEVLNLALKKDRAMASQREIKVIEDAIYALSGDATEEQDVAAELESDISSFSGGHVDVEAIADEGAPLDEQVVTFNGLISAQEANQMVRSSGAMLFAAYFGQTPIYLLIEEDRAMTAGGLLETMETDTLPRIEAIIKTMPGGKVRTGLQQETMGIRYQSQALRTRIGLDRAEAEKAGPEVGKLWLRLENVRAEIPDMAMAVRSKIDPVTEVLTATLAKSVVVEDKEDASGARVITFKGRPDGPVFAAFSMQYDPGINPGIRTLGSLISPKFGITIPFVYPGDMMQMPPKEISRVLRDGNYFMGPDRAMTVYTARLSDDGNRFEISISGPEGNYYSYVFDQRAVFKERDPIKQYYKTAGNQDIVDDKRTVVAQEPSGEKGVTTVLHYSNGYLQSKIRSAGKDELEKAITQFEEQHPDVPILPSNQMTTVAKAATANPSPKAAMTTPVAPDRVMQVHTETGVNTVNFGGNRFVGEEINSLLRRMDELAGALEKVPAEAQWQDIGDVVDHDLRQRYNISPSSRIYMMKEIIAEGWGPMSMVFINEYRDRFGIGRLKPSHGPGSFFLWLKPAPAADQISVYQMAQGLMTAVQKDARTIREVLEKDRAMATEARVIQYLLDSISLGKQQWNEPDRIIFHGGINNHAIVQQIAKAIPDRFGVQMQFSGYLSVSKSQVSGLRDWLVRKKTGTETITPYVAPDHSALERAATEHGIKDIEGRMASASDDTVRPDAEETSKLIVSRRDQAIAANGGIDLTQNGMNWKIRKDGSGVEMNIDPAMIERIRREGIDSLTPVIFRVTPVASIWPLVGLKPPKKQEERLAGV